MKWQKRGLIYTVDCHVHSWMITHAQVPTAYKISENVLRIYYGTRDVSNRTVTSYIEVEANNPQNVLYVHDVPVLGLGELGTFDDSGAMPSWVIDQGEVLYLYYTGWNQGVSVPYRNSIGLAVSYDNGRTFNRLYQGPVIDRTKTEPYFCGVPCVIVENGIWRMWYLSCVKWEIYKGVPEPFYHIKYAESVDGLDWERQGVVCINFKSPDEAGIVRPSVIKEDGIYKMWYSYRSYKGYRINRESSYRIGYAESDDGIRWIRKDESVGIGPSENGWDSEMIAYPYVYEHKGQKVMLYNGNGFGHSGFGYAVLA